MNEKISTGVEGLDEILEGGMKPLRTYLVRGAPGTGKTLMGVHFLARGQEEGEDTLFISFEETREELSSNLEGMDLSLDGVEFLNLGAETEVFGEGRGDYEIFYPGEVEEERVEEEIKEKIDSVQPSRVVLDPVTQLRYLATDRYQFRKMMHSFTTYLKKSGATVMITSPAANRYNDEDIQFMADGIVNLSVDDQGEEMLVKVDKYRGSPYLKGQHAMVIDSNGVQVYPKFHYEPGDIDFVKERLSSGIEEIDDMLKGGLIKGAVSMFTGPSGVGKTTFGALFLSQAAQKEDSAILYQFEETKGSFVERSESLGIPVREKLDEGKLRIEEIDPSLFTPGRLGGKIRNQVTEETEVVMIDGVDGLRQMQGEALDPLRYLHNITNYLKQQGKSVILIDEIPNITGDFKPSDAGHSYLADAIVFMRYMEYKGELRRALGILKNRNSDFERRLREFTFDERGVVVGEPLTGMRGILTGTPDWSTEIQRSEGKDG